MSEFTLVSGHRTGPRYRRSAPPPPEPAPTWDGVAQAAEPAPSRRHVLRVIAAMAGAGGLAATCGLPALHATIGEDAQASHADGAGVQRMHVGDTTSRSEVELDPMVAAAGAAAAALISWSLPLHGALHDGFGPRLTRPVPGVNAFHSGQDLAAGIGSTIHAAAAGIVAEASWWGTYGNWVLINHGHGLATGYAHLERIGVSVGQKVSDGQLIGLVGSTGASTGPHLHLEAHIAGVAVDPMPFFRDRGVALGR